MIQGSCRGLLAFIRWAAHIGVTPKKLRSSHIDKFLASDSFTLKKSGLKSFLNSFWSIIENKYGHSLVKKIVPHYQRNPSVNCHVEKFELHMRNAKGLTETSRRRYRTTIGQFLTYIFPQGKVNLNKIKPADILNFLKKRGEKFKNKTIRCDGPAIKCYMYYLFGKGEIKKDLSLVVPVITSWRNQNVIHTVDKNDMIKILMSCDLNTAIGVRDYSVLLLLMRYGLRPTMEGTGYPRIHDLRLTFVTKVILEWLSDKQDVHSLMPALSTYIGHNQPSDTYWYLTGVPELMRFGLHEGQR